MRFLIDEMFGQLVAEHLRASGHDAVHVAEVGLQAAADPDVLTLAASQGRLLVTENAADFLPLLDARIAAGMEVVPVVIALRANLPRGAGPMSRTLADRLLTWGEDRPDPYRHVHWLA